MKLPGPLTLALSAAAALSGCSSPSEAPPTAVSDAPARLEPAATGLYAGAAEANLDLPVGVPLGSYTGRLELTHAAPDERSSAYTTEFEPSFGIQTRIPVKVIWLQNNGQNVVLVKIDLGYAFDGMLFDIQNAIAEATGVDVIDKVVVATSHSHSSYGDYSHDAALYLGSDQLNTEILQRLVARVTDTAQNALFNLAPAAIGVGFDPSFDPIGVDQIFRDRRNENDDLPGVNGEIMGHGYKDPRLTLVRIDRSQGTSTPDDDEPIALIHAFGIHGTIMGESNMLTSVEGTGHIDLKVQEAFDQEVVVMHLQGAAGDQSPAGRQDGFARMEYLGEIAAPKILSLWNQTRTRSGDVPIELLTRSIEQDRDAMRITRQGTTNYYYTPFTPVYQGDDVVYNADGTVASPIDEFNTENGAALCSDDESYAIVGQLWGWETDVAPYFTCGNVEEIIALMDSDRFEFDLSWATAPLQSAQTTVISALKIGAVPIVSTDGSSDDDQVVMGFFPGEPVSLYSDVFRKELEEVNGYHYGVTIGYAQDHEGYLLTLEDWLAGGYEPQINQWGPIQGEFILEQLVELAGQFGTNDPTVPTSAVPHPVYEYFPLQPVVPDVTRNAGKVPARVPRYVYTFDGIQPTKAQPDAEVLRVSGLATYLWEGGDPGVDLPQVTLERETSPGSGAYETMRHHSGRPWSDTGPEILLTYTPSPLTYETAQRHYWLATFQAVSHEPNLGYSAGLPSGNYRFKVEGRARLEDGGSYPWPTQAYTVTSTPFKVVPQQGLVVTATAAPGGAVSLTAAYPAAERGFRLLSLNAENERSTNPLNAGGNTSAVARIEISSSSGQILWQNNAISLSTQQGFSSATLTTGLSSGLYTVKVTDVHGNSGLTTLSF